MKKRTLQQFFCLQFYESAINIMIEIASNRYFINLMFLETKKIKQAHLTITRYFNQVHKRFPKKLV